MEYYSSLDASQLDAETPTLFEVISANQLEALLSPSFRYVLVHYAARYPKYLLRLANKFDELNLALRIALEWYFIHFWQGSFTENFYGLKRVRKARFASVNARLSQIAPSKIEERRALSGIQKLVSVFEIAGAGYISEKLGYCYEVWYPKYITRQLKPQDPNDKLDVLKTNFKKLFVQLYPYLRSLIRMGNFATTLLFLSGSSKSPTLLSYLFNISFARLNQYDYDKNEPKKLNNKDNLPNRIRPPTSIEYILRLIKRRVTGPGWKGIKIILGTFFPLVIFGLKFLEWWNNSDFTQKIAKSSGNFLEDILPPPSTISKIAQKEIEKSTHRMYKSGKDCPLCHEEINNPAIIETGYVFCYSCIYNYLSQSHKLSANKKNESIGNDTVSEDDDDDDDDDDDNDDEKNNDKTLDISTINISRGGRCPVTGKKLLGCKWNKLKQEWDIEGIRRLMF